MSFASALKKVVSFVKHSAVTVSDLFVKLVGHDAAVNFAHASMDVLKSDLGAITVDAVHAVESLDPNAPGDVKKAQAFAQIVTDAKAKGIETSNSIISMLIELAVNVLKGHAQPA